MRLKIGRHEITAPIAFTADVYVNEREVGWMNFLHHDVVSVLGIAAVLLAIFVIIPKVRRKGRL
jgi:hypothetical protein